MKRIFKIQGHQIKCDDDGVANAHNGQDVSIVRPLHCHIPRSMAELLLDVFLLSSVRCQSKSKLTRGTRPATSPFSY
jgi:hypothetical protein